MFEPLIRLWSPVEVRATIPAPPETVYAVLTEPTTYPGWLVGTQRIRAVDPDFPQPGSRFHHSVGPADEATVDDDSKSLAAEPVERLVLEVHVGPMRGTVDFQLLPAPDGTEVRFREVLIGVWRPLMPGVRPVLHARNTKSLEQLSLYVVSVAGSQAEARS